MKMPQTLIQKILYLYANIFQVRFKVINIFFILIKIYNIFKDNSTEDSLDEIDSEFDSGNGDGASNNSNSGSYKTKRCILPKHATVVMKTWLFQHLMVI